MEFPNKTKRETKKIGRRVSDLRWFSIVGLESSKIKD
jgi:hypothetical protein